jgi:beta-glucosidase
MIELKVSAMTSMARHSGQTGFRDLNKNGRMDPYEDPSRPIEERVEDLLAQMTLEEKAGLLFHAMAPVDVGRGGPPGLPPATERIAGKAMNHFNALGSADARAMAEWHNRLQATAEATRLGIPVTLSTDPRHAFAHNPGASMLAGAFSQWPEPLGLAAIGDADLVQAFADIARQEYLAVGIRVALHPMADLATEPRWGRINGTFGEDATLAAGMVAAYIRGFQGETLGVASVACMTKHFPGGGPQKDGEDAHFVYGREQVYPGDNFAYHLIPFEAAFAAGTAQIMPYYGMPIGTEYEEVGFGFNKGIITGLLRERYGFDGVVCADWGLLTDGLIFGRTLEARAWGVEHLSLAERVRKALEAGVDQFGGEACPEVIVELVRGGGVPEERIDRSARRLLRDKFRLGLFDDPYVDAEAAEAIVGNAWFRAAGEAAQRRSIVLLKNASIDDGAALPLREARRIYVEGVAPEVAARYGQVVADPAAAKVAILRLAAPFEPRDSRPLESFFHAGSLAFAEEERARILRITATVPTIVCIYLDRPAVIPEIAEAVAGLLADFGASDEAVLDVIFGQAAPSARLPFELPSSMEAVRRQKEDVPYDSEDPLFRFGHGLSY